MNKNHNFNKRKLDKGYYFLWTTSVFQSQYEGDNEEYISTFYNSNLVTNRLLGKEWSVSNSLSLQLNGRFTYNGGRKYTPIDLDASIASGEEVLIENQPFSKRLTPYIRPDLKLGMIYNQGNRLTHSFSIDFQNFINRDNELTVRYDEEDRWIDIVNQRGFFPDVRYQLLF